ncbi:hypothetical protein [Streptomyces gilvosporeus]|uniref:Uncharacterized protein n=1 Tax=Streptomyces gilvosporeus TaxID=553510 RepID=A0A1V0TTN8_9ACTN|nr:hypothetical protein [Streptomyces gilvosporeus]ARF56261.1 hypothetical protein B1H19_20600 [Streptomyces gilvosporeus]
MQIVLTVVVLLALIALGAAFISRLNGQQAGRMAIHHHADLHPPFLHRTPRRPQDEPLAEPPEPPPSTRGEPPWRSDTR